MRMIQKAQACSDELTPQPLVDADRPFVLCEKELQPPTVAHRRACCDGGVTLRAHDARDEMRRDKLVARLQIPVSDVWEKGGENRRR